MMMASDIIHHKTPAETDRYLSLTFLLHEKTIDQKVNFTFISECNPIRFNIYVVEIQSFLGETVDTKI